MPPPPPSKSYLLVLDTDSEDEEEDSYRIRTLPHPSPRSVVISQDPSSPVPITTISPEETSTTVNRRRPHVIEDDEEDEEESAHAGDTPDEDEDEEDSADNNTRNETSNSPEKKKKQLTKSQKKKRARKRKKKKSKSSAYSKGVRFSTVSVQVYPRAFGLDTVPVDGGWPLGMELQPMEGLETEHNLEEYETERQVVLRQRWNEKEDSNVDEKIRQQLLTRPAGQPLVLETRQWDFRSKLKNPLFGALEEDHRQTLLLNSTNEEAREPSAALKGRSRSNSVSSSQGSSSPKRRSRSSSFSHTERFNETYNQVYVHHVRNGLEHIRTERTKSGATGCTCRKLTVYIPPKGGGGKKAQYRRLKPSKLTQELKKRNLYDPSASREDLEKILHTAIESEPCCSDEDCFCYRNGIECQDDACTCWHDSHGHTKNATTSLTVQDISKRCGNPLGTTTVDMGAILSFRKHVLESSICQPVTTTMDQ